jgi:UDP-4-amino-4,6-dideoxy-N-acetyl-beta-L-altrosamine transaminase
MPDPTLALHGGRPVRASVLPYGRQLLEEDDIQAVVGALRASLITTGASVDAFEKRFAESVGARHAVAVSSGTAALHAAVAAAGIGPGDEVVTTPLTFVATSNAVLYAGGAPVFADVRADTLNVDAAALAAKITPRTRALLPVHFAGQPCEMEEIRRLARGRGLPIIADAAHALGAEYRGRRAGVLGDLTIFSFHPVKHVTTGEGGMVVTDDADAAERVRRFRNHGLASDAAARAASGALYSEMIELGFNYRLTDIQCALGASQLAKLDRFLKRREAIAERYLAALQDVRGLSPARVVPDARHAWHIFPVLLDLERLTTDRATIFQALRAENIGVAFHYVPAYWHPYYASLGFRRGLCPVTEGVTERLLTLPIFPAMTDADVDDVLVALDKVLGHYLR